MVQKLTLRTDWQNPAPDRLHGGSSSFDSVMAEHDASIAAGADGYLDPRTRYFVFNAGYLKDRGTCCDSNCRHCPYDRS